MALVIADDLGLKNITEPTTNRPGTPGQDWASLINYNFTLIDEHNHNPGHGNRVISTSLGTGDLDCLNFSILNGFALDFQSVDSAQIPTSLSIFVDTDGDLAYKTITGDILKITSGTTLNPVNLPEGFVVASGTPLCVFDINSISFGFFNFESSDKDYGSISTNKLSCNAVGNLNSIINVTANDIITNDILDGLNQKQTIRYKNSADNLFKGFNISHCLWKISNDVTARTYGKLTENKGFYIESDSILPLGYVIESPQYYKGAPYFIARDNNTQVENPVGYKYITESITFNDLVNNSTNKDYILASGFSNNPQTGKILLGFCPILNPIDGNTQSYGEEQFKIPNVQNLLFQLILQPTSDGLNQLIIRTSFSVQNFPPLQLTFRYTYSQLMPVEIS